MMSWLVNNANIVGLLFFFSVFVIVLVRTYYPANKQRIEAHGRIPLEDGND